MVSHEFANFSYDTSFSKGATDSLFKRILRCVYTQKKTAGSMNIMTGRANTANNAENKTSDPPFWWDYIG